MNPNPIFGVSLPDKCGLNYSELSDPTETDTGIRMTEP